MWMLHVRLLSRVPRSDTVTGASRDVEDHSFDHLGVPDLERRILPAFRDGRQIFGHTLSMPFPEMTS